ncbi:acetyltransferase, GNAT family [Synechococcus sp. PCC 7335]|uniref:GNAT family N-acetyltransferase n=1 Tax=Synechococcus sp. (strain ATCC 29403 / PCC 7335) TaxID=91464 RepID=UPI00017EBC12|nr:GNAT family N-acetyltransferase [Synechococcus sp. PCC 7335]EDX85620.1 acetyltransferase, GNAT family [Synechococcus sp. PCC 7335]
MSTRIRNFHPSDIEALVHIYNRYIEETTITFDITPHTIEYRREHWMSHYHASGRHRLLVAECDRKVVGYASSSQFRTKAAYDTSVETSIYLDMSFRAKGIGTQLYTALFGALAKEDVHRAYAGITLPNDVSIGIHQKFGFEQVGLFKEVGRKFGKYWDVAWFEKTIGDR